MTVSPPRVDPAHDLDLVAEATEHLLTDVASLDPAQLPLASALPGWTRGHVLAHVARNADAMVNLLTWARTGEERSMYASDEARDADIAAGATRTAAEQLADLREASARFADAARGLTDAAWDAKLVVRSGATVTARELPFKRLREVLVHHVDLDHGYTPAHWPEEFVRRELAELAAKLDGDERISAGELVVDDETEGARPVRLRIGAAEAEPEVTVHGPGPALLGWLTRRSSGDGLLAHRVEDGGPTELPAVPTLY